MSVQWALGRWNPQKCTKSPGTPRRMGRIARVVNEWMKSTHLWIRGRREHLHLGLHFPDRKRVPWDPHWEHCIPKDNSPSSSPLSPADPPPPTPPSPPPPSFLPTLMLPQILPPPLHSPALKYPNIIISVHPHVFASIVATTKIS